MLHTTRMRRSLAVGTGVLVLSAGATAQAAQAAAAETAPVGGRSSHEKVIHLVSQVAQASYLGPEGLVQGSTLVFSEDLFRRGRQVGRNGAVCTVTRVRPDDTGDALCSGTGVLPGGQLTWKGLVPVKAVQVEGVERAVPAGDFDVAVTGGTGRYATARGVIHEHPLDPRTTQKEVHLLR